MMWYLIKPLSPSIKVVEVLKSVKGFGWVYKLEIESGGL